MELIRLTDSAYHLRGGSNAGLVVQDGQAVLIDAGLDKDTARKILRHIEALGAKLAAIVITHAHADHFGGAATVRARTGAPVLASPLEASIVASPLLEPLYLFSGAAPVEELRHKFTLADACPVDKVVEPGAIVLGDISITLLPAPGHAPDQIMVASGGVCYLADACFAPEVAQKHVIPFYVDVEQAANTLATLPQLDGIFDWFVPGHGPAVREIGPWAQDNLRRLDDIRQGVEEALAVTGEAAEIVARVAARMGLMINNPVSWWLTQTTIHSCLSALQKADRAFIQMDENRLVWKRGPRP